MVFIIKEPVFGLLLVTFLTTSSIDSALGDRTGYLEVDRKHLNQVTDTVDVTVNT